jgi:hypothetical protein
MKLAEEIPFFERVAERIPEQGRRVSFLKDAELYLYEFCVLLPEVGIASLEMKANGRFELTTKTDSMIYGVEGALILRDMDSDTVVGIYEGDMASITKDTVLRGRTDDNYDFKGLIFTKPHLSVAYPELSEA